MRSRRCPTTNFQMPNLLAPLASPYGFGAKPQRLMRLSGSGAFDYSEGDRYRSQRSVRRLSHHINAHISITYHSPAAASTHLASKGKSLFWYRTPGSNPGPQRALTGRLMGWMPSAFPRQMLPFQMWVRFIYNAHRAIISHQSHLALSTYLSPLSVSDPRQCRGSGTEPDRSAPHRLIACAPASQLLPFFSSHPPSP